MRCGSKHGNMECAHCTPHCLNLLWVMILIYVKNITTFILYLINILRCYYTTHSRRTLYAELLMYSGTQLYRRMLHAGHGTCQGKNNPFGWHGIQVMMMGDLSAIMKESPPPWKYKRPSSVSSSKAPPPYPDPPLWRLSGPSGLR